ncbi:MAG: peptidylprolyl isomerase [Planctomycetes bacterium]|nr:peptidylprolyl isomerase [Planctomycetota bacterium]
MQHARFVAVLAAVLFLCSSCSEKAPEPAPNQATLTDPQAPLQRLAAYAVAQKIDTKRPGWRKLLPKPPQAQFPAGHTYYWNLATNAGDIKLRLMHDVAPMHVSSTIFLTQLGFYDGLKFHRVMRGFMAQGGCPDGNGRGGPGYQYAGEFSPDVKHDKPGILSMANAGPDTDGSQFFITFRPTPSLDGKHTVFGEVTAETMGTVRALEAATDPNGGETPTSELVIQRATITID